MAEPIVKVACYLPVSRELLADVEAINAVVQPAIERGLDDALFTMEIGRSRLTDVGADWWRPWRWLPGPRAAS